MGHKAGAQVAALEAEQGPRVEGVTPNDWPGCTPVDTYSGSGGRLQQPFPAARSGPLNGNHCRDERAADEHPHLEVGKSLAGTGFSSPNWQPSTGGQPPLIPESPELPSPEVMAQLLPAGSLGVLRPEVERASPAKALTGRALVLDSGGRCHVSILLTPSSGEERRRIRLLYSSEMAAVLKLPSWLASICGRCNGEVKPAGGAVGGKSGALSEVAETLAEVDKTLVADEAMMSRRRAAYSWASAAGFSKSGAGAPKVMADVMESITGAVFLDSGRCPFTR